MRVVDDDDMIYRPQGTPPAEEPAYSDDGVDLTLIRWMLSLTPAERLQVLQEHQDAIDAAREGHPEWISEPS
jgi:hypothetical protein